jgi:uncharacterized protein YqiB (DUF1249 family)
MYKEKVVNIEVICKYLWREIYKYLESKDQTITALAETIWKSTAYITDLLNGRRNTSNLEVYKRMALTIWMSEKKFAQLYRDAKKHEYSVSTWEDLSNTFSLDDFKLEDLKLALSREYGTKDEQVLDDIMAYARFKIEQGDTKFLKNLQK